MEFFDLAVTLAHDVFPAGQPSMRDDEHEDHDAEWTVPLVAWLTTHRPHGIILTAASAAPGYHWHLCPCGSRIVINPEKTQ